MANVGAPLGNTNAARGRRWRDALSRAVDAYPNRAVSLEVNKGIDEMAYLFVQKMAAEKDLGFFREYGDRSDGKPPQAIVGDDELPALRVEGVLKLVKPDAKEGE
jgi:hypothetical protein